jgi:hypothetical protein
MICSSIFSGNTHKLSVNNDNKKAWHCRLMIYRLKA